MINQELPKQLSDFLLGKSYSFIHKTKVLNIKILVFIFLMMFLSHFIFFLFSSLSIFLLSLGASLLAKTNDEQGVYLIIGIILVIVFILIAIVFLLIYLFKNYIRNEVWFVFCEKELVILSQKTIKVIPWNSFLEQIKLSESEKNMSLVLFLKPGKIIQGYSNNVAIPNLKKDPIIKEKIVNYIKQNNNQKGGWYS